MACSLWACGLLAFTRRANTVLCFRAFSCLQAPVDEVVCLCACVCTRMCLLWASSSFVSSRAFSVVYLQRVRRSRFFSPLISRLVALTFVPFICFFKEGRACVCIAVPFWWMTCVSTAPHL